MMPQQSANTQATSTIQMIGCIIPAAIDGLSEDLHYLGEVAVKSLAAWVDCSSASLLKPQMLCAYHCQAGCFTHTWCFWLYRMGHLKQGAAIISGSIGWHWVDCSLTRGLRFRPNPGLCICLSTCVSSICSVGCYLPLFDCIGLNS